MSEQAISAFYDIELQQKEWGLYKPDGFVFFSPTEIRTNRMVIENSTKTFLRQAGVTYQNSIHCATHLLPEHLSYNSIFQPWLKF